MGVLAYYSSLQITICVVLTMIIFYWVGHILILRKNRKGDEDGKQILGIIEGSLIGLLALILGFTFSISNARYDKRMNLIVEEANDIGTAILRADLYPDSLRLELRKEFKTYVESRIEFNSAGRNLKEMNRLNDSATAIQKRLWKIVATAGQDKENLVRTSNMVPALNAMIDVVSTRNAALIAKVPDLILFLLFALCFTASFLLGYGDNKRPEWGVVTSFLIMVGLTIYMILDLDRPRSGVITMKEVHYFITSLRSMFDNP